VLSTGLVYCTAVSVYSIQAYVVRVAQKLTLLLYTEIKKLST